MKIKEKNEDIEIIENVLKLAKKQGAKQTIITRENTMGGCWGWILTKNNNLLYVQNDYYWGVTFSLEYVPSRKFGSGCQASDRISQENIIIDEIEASGLNFAGRLGARLFTEEQIQERIINILQNKTYKAF